MANEVEVFELHAPSSGAPVRPMPPIAKQTLSIGGAASAGFNRSTAMVTIVTTTACRVQFSPAAGTTPDGSTATFPLAANVPYDFEAVAGRKVIAVAA